MTLYQEAAAEIEWLAENFRETNARPVVDADTGIVGWKWPDLDDQVEYFRLKNLAHRLRKTDRRPDPLGEALNSGDGSYRP